MAGRMDLGLRDRVYLVTGGSRGLGFAAAQAFVAEGARVLLSAPHESTAAAAVDSPHAGRRRSAFESVFLGAVRLARVLAADLGSGRDDGAAAASLTETGR